MQPLQPEAITLDTILLGLQGKRHLHVDVLRLDKIHPVISGNKWFKLSRYISQATSERATHLISFGGAYSNHLLAVAAAGELNSLETIGIIRGEEPHTLSPTLTDCKQLGMELHFVSRARYRAGLLPPGLTALKEQAVVIPPGGFGEAGANGAQAILDLAGIGKHTHIFCAVGTGTMLAGLVAGAGPAARCTGIAVTAGNASLRQEINQLLPAERADDFDLLSEYAFRGFAKFEPQLIGFMNYLYGSTGIPTDFVYTGKLFFAVADLVARNSLPDDAKVLVIHSGGLQGNRSLPVGSLQF